MSIAYHIAKAPSFTPQQVREWWNMNPATHVALGFCPQHQKRMLLNAMDHEYGRQPSCCKCGEWLTTLEIVSIKKRA